MIKALVTWFNRNSGEGWVSYLDSDNNTHSGGPIYACNIKGKRTWFENTACVYYAEGEIVDVTCDGNFIIGHTEGIFDSAKWATLDHDRLAFKCDQNGAPMTGLFSTKVG